MEKAARLFEEAARDRPDDYQALLLVGQVYRALGDDEAARAAAHRGLERARRQLELDPGDARARILGAIALAEIGERKEALRWARKARALDPDNSSTLYNQACVLARLGEVDEAIDCLEDAALSGYRTREWMEHDSDLDPLREHPRFQALLGRLPSEES